MKFGIFGDSHHNKMRAMEHIVYDEFMPRGVQQIINTGDIKPEHMRPEFFGNLPTICVLTDEQFADKRLVIQHKDELPEILLSPPKWKFTWPNNRIVDLGEYYAYIGHKRSFDLLSRSEQELRQTFHDIRKRHNNVRWMFSGHTHHQIYMESRLISFINPGAIEDSYGTAGGYEFAILDTESEEVIFSRIQESSPVKKPLKLGVISDSFDISEMDPTLWGKLAKRLQEQNVTHIIHCGNISLNDIGRPELGDFSEVWYNLRQDQGKGPSEGNWKLIDANEPIITINGYQFCVQLFLGPEIFKQSEAQMESTTDTIQTRFPETNFILCGATRNAFLEEGQKVFILNPGDVIRDKDYAVIDLPRYEITFGRIQNEPFPSII